VTGSQPDALRTGSGGTILSCRIVCDLRVYRHIYRLDIGNTNADGWTCGPAVTLERTRYEPVPVRPSYGEGCSGPNHQKPPNGGERNQQRSERIPRYAACFPATQPHSPSSRPSLFLIPFCPLPFQITIHHTTRTDSPALVLPICSHTVQHKETLSPVLQKLQKMKKKLPERTYRVVMLSVYVRTYVQVTNEPLPRPHPRPPFRCKARM